MDVNNSATAPKRPPPPPPPPPPKADARPAAEGTRAEATAGKAAPANGASAGEDRARSELVAAASALHASRGAAARSFTDTADAKRVEPAAPGRSLATNRFAASDAANAATTAGARANAAANAAVRPAANPIVNAAAKPIADGAANPIVNAAAKPIVNGAANPIANAAANPMANAAASPMANAAANPITNAAAAPRPTSGGAADALGALAGPNTRRVLDRIAKRMQGLPSPTAPAQPGTAGDAVSGANDPRRAAQNLADRAGIGRLPGVPFSPAREHDRANRISQALMRGETPTPFKGRTVEVTPAERRVLQGNDQAARQRTADEIGRREARRDSLVQAAGTKENAAKMEQAYANATPEQRAQDVPQRDRQAVADNLGAIGEVLIASRFRGVLNMGRGALQRLGRALDSSPAGRAARQAYDQFRGTEAGQGLPPIPGGRGRTTPARTRSEGTPRGSEGGPRPPRAPRSDAQRAQRRETDRLRRERERVAREAQPPPPPPPRTLPN